MEAIALQILSVSAAILAFEGTRRWATGVRNREVRVWIAAGIGFCLLRAAVSLYMANGLETMAESLKIAPKPLPADWAVGVLTPEEREKKSRGYASVAFVGSGTLYRHFDRKGQEVVFVPTQEELRRRDELVATATEARVVSGWHWASAVLWTLTVVLAVLAGQYLGRVRNDG